MAYFECGAGFGLRDGLAKQWHFLCENFWKLTFTDTITIKYNALWEHIVTVMILVYQGLRG